MSARMHAPANDMIRKLRVKFIAVNMALATLVLAVAFTTICALDYRSSADEVYESLENAVSRVNGDVLHGFGRGALGDDDAEAPALDELENRNDIDGGFTPPQIGGKFGRERDGIPVAVYAYNMNAHESVQMMGRSSASVSTDVLSDAIEQAAFSKEESGYLASSGLFFAKGRSQATGITFVAFADGSLVNGWQSLAWGLLGIGLIALAVLFIFNLLFSRWALRPVQEAWQQQQQFIADASHELKTPLTVILANSSILEREGDKTVASQAQWIESTKLEAERMQGLVTDMLELARADAAGKASKPLDHVENVQFSRLVDGEVLTFESVAYERNIECESRIEPGIVVRGDERRLQRLVGVLLDNACKYAPAHAKVSTSLEAQEGSAVLRVNNTGDPIPEEDLAHIFDRFYRVDKARTHGEAGEAPDGYGLGLSIAQQIAQEHKGVLTVSSNAEDGTTFTLKLPLA